MRLVLTTLAGTGSSLSLSLSLSLSRGVAVAAPQPAPFAVSHAEHHDARIARVNAIAARHSASQQTALKSGAKYQDMSLAAVQK